MIYIYIAIILLIIIIFLQKGIPIFLYHQVNEVSNITPELFEKHLQILKKKKINTITISEFAEKKAPKNSFLITFDDGYYDNYKIVFPLLKKYNMKATIFLNTMYIAEKRWGETIPEKNSSANYKAIKKYLALNDATTEQYMTWPEIKEMSESGLVDFQAHSHKHMAIFKSLEFEGVFTEDSLDPTDIYLYKNIEEGFPKFPKRGEYSGKGIIINEGFFKKFQKFYFDSLKGKSEKDIKILGQEYINNHIDPYIIVETDAAAEKRITDEYLLNKSLIEANLKNKVEYFCWPWGHRNKKVLKSLKSLGVKGFITTKKGTNSYSPNLDMIRRIELRKFSTFKFKINLFIARNLILGKIYGWLS